MKFLLSGKVKARFANTRKEVSMTLWSINKQSKFSLLMHYCCQFCSRFQQYNLSERVTKKFETPKENSLR